MKKGISLIVLVITIIVMIILAASVVISLNNTGIIDKANHAVNLTDEKQIQDLAALVWVDAYFDENRTEPLEDVVKTELANQGVKLEDWNITVTDTGVSVSKKGEVVLIDFKVGSKSFKAEQGMVWGEWINSEYNTEDYGFRPGVEMVGTALGEISKDGVAVYVEDEIKATDYELTLSTSTTDAPQAHESNGETASFITVNIDGEQAFFTQYLWDRNWNTFVSSKANKWAAQGAFAVEADDRISFTYNNQKYIIEGVTKDSTIAAGAVTYNAILE